jgi:hypothetical protein
MVVVVAAAGRRVKIRLAPKVVVGVGVAVNEVHC